MRIVETDIVKIEDQFCKKFSSPLAIGYRLELDVTPEIN